MTLATFGLGTKKFLATFGFGSPSAEEVPRTKTPKVKAGTAQRHIVADVQMGNIGL